MTTVFNDGFESGEWTHRVKVFPVGGDPYETEIGNIFTPVPDWLFWFRHDPGTFDQPEARYCWTSGDPVRVHSGEGAYMWFSFYRRHDAGLMRQVRVEPGSRLRLTAWAHAWSNHEVEGHGDCYNDPRCSCGVGTGCAALSPDDIPALNGDPWNDAVSNSASVVGIDPTGGTNPFADTVVWGQPLYIYNCYQQLSVDMEPNTSDTVTIFIRNATLWPFKHNDVYWDDVVLEAVDVEPPPSPEKCVPPRVQYARTYVLLPQMEQYEAMEWRSAAAIATADDLRTIGHSADDAGVGPLDRAVVAVNPGSWTGNAADLKAFYEEYYPGAEYEAVEARTPWEMAVKLLPLLDGGDIALAQTDPRWDSYDFGEDPGGGTIGDYGCFVTGLAIILRKIYQRKVTPPVLDKILVASRAAFTDDNLLVWENAIDLFPIFYDCIKSNEYYPAAGLAALLNAGWEIILRRLDGKHFVYLEGMDGDALHIIDTWDGKRKVKLASDYAGIRAARVAHPAPVPVPPPPRPTRGHIGLHLQTMVPGWEEYVKELRPPVCKVLAAQEDIIGIKCACPDTVAVYRLTDNDYGGILDAGDPHAGARRWLAKFQDGLYRTVEQLQREAPGLEEPLFYVESINEVYDSDAGHVQRAVNFDIAFLEELAALGLPIGGVVFTAGVGNPYHVGQYELLLPLAEKCVQLNGLLGYHNYWYADRLVSDWEWHAGRWTEMDKVFVQNGVYPRWFGAESGVIHDAHNGWRSDLCYGGNRDRYLADIVTIDEMIGEWNRTHGDRYLGLVLFTSGIGAGWENFQITRAEMEDLARRLGS